jgi:AraC-like DNA-binding protein
MTQSSRDIRIEDHAGKSGPIVAGRLTPLAPRPHRSSVVHDYAALALYVGGTARIEQRTMWTLEVGDVLIVPACEPHRMIEASQPDIWWVGFCVPCLAADISAALLEPFDRVRAGSSPVVRIAADRQAFLESLFRELSATATAGNPDALVQQSLLTLIVSEVRRAAAWSNAGSNSGLVVECLRFIESHCLQPLTLRDLAAAMRRTPSYITTALTRATGRSAVAWIIAFRMAEARRRLLHSDEQVDIVAERVGYADTTHFIRLFRRTHGMTPAAWRASMRRAPAAR